MRKYSNRSARIAHVAAKPHGVSAGADLGGDTSVADDTDDTDQANAAALQAAAQHIIDGLREDSPSEKISALWRTVKGQDQSMFVRNRLIEARMTDSDGRHPLWGNKRHWYSENERNPERTDWATRSLFKHADDAEEKFRDEWVHSIAIDSPYFDEVK